MKLSIFFYFIVLVSILCISCSSHEFNPGNEINNEASNYFPNTLNSYWKYDVNTTNNTTDAPVMSTDSLYIKSKATSNFTLGVNDTLPANGTMSQLLTNGTLTNNTKKLLFNGRYELPEVIDSLAPIQLEDFVMYDTGASIGTELSTKTDTITQSFQNIPLTVNYTISTIANGITDNVTVNGTNYTNVVSTKLVINLKISTKIALGGTALPINILDEQDVLVNTYLFAPNIGMINATNEFNYQISSTALAALAVAGIDLPVPETGSRTNTEVLTDYFIGE